MTLCDPAQSEEGRLDSRFVEQGQNGVGIGLDPAGQIIPGVAGDAGLEGADLEPVLDVHRQGVQHVCPSGRLGGVGVARRLLAVLDPFDEEGQDAADDHFLLVHPRLQGPDPPLQRNVADAAEPLFASLDATQKAKFIEEKVRLSRERGLD